MPRVHAKPAVGAQGARSRSGGAHSVATAALAAEWSIIPGEHVGEFLRRTREQLGIPLQQVSFTTRIPAASLRMIEEGQFAELPGETFVRGFIRAYAGAIGIPAAGAIRLFDLRCNDAAPPLLRPPSPADLRSRKVGLAFAVLILIVVLTLIVSLVLRGRWDVDRDLSSRGSSPLPTEST